MVIRGSEVKLYKSGVEFGCAKETSMSFNTDMREVTSATDNNFRSYKPNLSTWTVNCSGLAATVEYTFAQIAEDWKNRTLITVQFTFNTGTEFITFSGNAMITGLELGGNLRAAATYNVSLQGSGGITITNTITPPIIIGNVNRTTYIALGGETFITLPALVGQTALLVVARGSMVNDGDFITSGTPTGNQIKYTSSTGRMDFENPAVTGEFWTILYK